MTNLPHAGSRRITCRFTRTQFRTVRRLARLPQLSDKGKQRLAMVGYAQVAGIAAAAAAHGVSQKTVRRWLVRYDPRDLRSLEDRSSQPRTRRRRTWTTAQIIAVRELRNAPEGRGKGKAVLQVLLAAQGIHLSVSTVGRILTYLRETHQLHAPRTPVPTRRRTVRRPYAMRRPPGTPPPTRPGDLIQLDTVHVAVLPGQVVRQFSAIDVVTREAHAVVHRSATARSAAATLTTIQAAFSTPIRAIQIDGGSEFMAEFEQACQDQGIRLYVLPPRSPKLNGCVERFNGTSRTEFWRWYDGPPDPVEIQPELDAWITRYNTRRPHTSLGYRTPIEVATSMLQGHTS